MASRGLPPLGNFKLLLVSPHPQLSLDWELVFSFLTTEAELLQIPDLFDRQRVDQETLDVLEYRMRVLIAIDKNGAFEILFQIAGKPEIQVDFALDGFFHLLRINQQAVVDFLGDGWFVQGVVSRRGQKTQEKERVMQTPCTVPSCFIRRFKTTLLADGRLEQKEMNHRLHASQKRQSKSQKENKQSQISAHQQSTPR